MAFERNFGNVTYNVLFNPPQYLVATIDAPDRRGDPADLYDPAGPLAALRA